MKIYRIALVLTLSKLKKVIHVDELKELIIYYF